MATNRFEKRKQAIDRAIREEITAYKDIYARADNDDRDPSDEERLEIESHLKAIETLKVEREGVEENIKTLAHVDDIGREIGPALGNVSVTSEPHDRMYDSIQKSMPINQAYAPDLGRMFTESAGYKSLIREYREGGRLPSQFSTGQVSMETKGTLGELSAFSVATGGQAIPQPDVQPGIIQTLFQRLTVADLVLQGQASSNVVRYITEGTATSGAAGVGQGSAKPESTLGFTSTDESIKKIATMLPVSEEMLEDAPAIQSYINGRLILFIQIAEEQQLLQGGSGSSAEVYGFLNASRGVPTFTGAATDALSTQLFRGLNTMRGSYFLEPEWICLHPSDYETMRLYRDSTGGTLGAYLGGGPFVGAYGQGQMSNPSNQVTGALETIWNKPVYVTANVAYPGVAKGTALVGTRANAQVWRRGGLSVEASNSHASFFQTNLIAIRAEERLGLTVYRAGGYLKVVFS